MIANVRKKRNKLYPLEHPRTDIERSLFGIGRCRRGAADYPERGVYT
jgi:hypothetical protein